MKRMLATSIACTWAAVAIAQTAPPAPSASERQKDVSATTEAGSGSSASTQKTAAQQAANVKTSKQTPKMSKEEKSKLAKDATKLNVNPENSSGQAATARMQGQTGAASKATSKQNTDLKTKDGKAQLGKELQQKSSP
jgi:hypothetical protein